MNLTQKAKPQPEDFFTSPGGTLVNCNKAAICRQTRNTWAERSFWAHHCTPEHVCQCYGSKTLFLFIWKKYFLVYVKILTDITSNIKTSKNKNEGKTLRLYQLTFLMSCVVFKWLAMTKFDLFRDHWDHFLPIFWCVAQTGYTKVL